MLFSFLSFIFILSQPLMAKQYGIPAGEKAPHFVVKDVKGSLINTKKMIQDGPIVLVFYRGGWCPFCNIQLRSLHKEVVPKIAPFKAKIIAISVDQVTNGLKTLDKLGSSIQVVSDSDASLIKQYRVAYQVPMAKVEKMRAANIDLEKAAGKKHHIIAIPAVYVIGSDGNIKFSFSDENYKIRAANRDILEAIQTMAPSP